MRAIQGQGSGKGPGIGFLKEVLKVEAGLGAGKSPPPCACTAFWSDPNGFAGLLSVDPCKPCALTCPLYRA
jgi:hypothetical protein